MTTGDLKNNLRKLHTELKLINYAGALDIEGLGVGRPSAFLPLLHFVVNEFSLELAQYFYSKGYELLGKNDTKFIQIVYRILRDEFNAKTSLTKEQFFTLGFAERKLQLVTFVLRSCRLKSEVLKPKKRKTVAGLNSRKLSNNQLHRIQAEAPHKGEPNPVMDGLYKVDRHTQNVKYVATTCDTMDTKYVTVDSPRVALDGMSTGNYANKTSLASAHLGLIDVAATSKTFPQAPVSCKKSSRPIDGTRLCDSSNSNGVTEGACSKEENPRSVPLPVPSACKSSLRSSEIQSAPVIATTHSNTGLPVDSPTKIGHFFVHKENVPPGSVSKKLSLVDQSKNGGEQGLSCTVTSSQLHICRNFNTRTEKKFSAKSQEISSVNSKEGALHSKDVCFNPAGADGMICPSSQDEGLLPLEDLSTGSNGAVLVSYIKMQQNWIKQLQKDARDAAAHIQELVQRNSELSARVMVLETAVTLLQEKIN